MLLIRFGRLIRETITIGWMRDALGSSLNSDEIATQELEMDKEIIKLLQPAMKDRQSQRANDLIHLLNLVNSLDTASKLAAYYNLITLQEKIAAWKEWREENDDPEEDRSQRRSWAKGTQPLPANDEMVGHLLGGSGGRPQDFRPAPAFTKRSLTNAVPNYGSNAFARKTEQSSPFTRRVSGIGSSRQLDENCVSSDAPEPESYESAPVDKAYTPSPPPEGKRKRSTEDDGDEQMAISSKRARVSAFGKASESSSSSIPPPQMKKGVVPAGARPNPFARTLAPAKSLVKSNTFFEKVDAAEVSAPAKKGEYLVKNSTTTCLFTRELQAKSEKRSKQLFSAWFRLIHRRRVATTRKANPRRMVLRTTSQRY